VAGGMVRAAMRTQSKQGFRRCIVVT
jgi:hypothetical protein